MQLLTSQVFGLRRLGLPGVVDVRPAPFGLSPSSVKKHLAAGFGDEIAKRIVAQIQQPPSRSARYRILTLRLTVHRHRDLLMCGLSSIDARRAAGSIDASRIAGPSY
jgi:hypothetical protein